MSTVEIKTLDGHSLVDTVARRAIEKLDGRTSSVELVARYAYDLARGASKGILKTETKEPAAIWPDQGSPLRPKIRIEAVQGGSGAASPDNIRPISGINSVKVYRSGKNLLDVSTIEPRNSTTVNPVTDGVVVATADAAYGSARSDVIRLLGGVKYTLSLKVSNLATNRVLVGLRTVATDAFVSGVSFSITSIGESTTTFTPSADLDVYFIVITTFEEAKSASVTLEHVQLEVGSTRTDFERYHGDVFKLDLGTTIYGGVLDVAGKVLIIDKEYRVLNGSESWSYYSGATEPYFHLNIGSYGSVVESAESQLCSHYKYGNILPTTTGQNTFCCYNSTTGNSARLAIRTGVAGMTSVSAWKDLLASDPVTVVYTLSEPHIIQVSDYEISALEGLNMVFCDAASMEVTYSVALARMYEDILARLEALEKANGV